MVQLTCPSILNQGTCTDPACRYEHNAYNCILCSIVFDNGAAYNEHLSTKGHVNKTRGESGALVFCTICQKYVPGMKNWRDHVSSARHASRASEQGLSPDAPPEEPEQVPGHQLCAVCNRHIPSRYWANHPNQPRHKEREQFLKFTSAVEETEKDKNGLSVVGDFDFQIVDPEQAASGVLRTGKIQSEVTSTRTRLLEVRLASSKGQQTFSPSVPFSSCYCFSAEEIYSFTVTLRSSSPIIMSRSPLTFSIKMSQAHLGRAEDRLELFFEDVKLQSRFMISRSLQTGSTKEILDRVRRLYLPPVVNSESYGKHFKYLVWIEEFQMDRDLEYYDITNAQLSRFNSYYYLTVPGLAEKRPSVLVGDRILVRKPNSPSGHWFEGGVHVVRREEVGLKFHGSFIASPNDRFLVRFKLNRYPMRRQHQALDSAFSQDRVMFPTKLHFPRSMLRTSAPMRWRNSLIADNPPQRQAVVSIAYREPGSMPFVIFGPPGTGKTVTMVEAILQVLAINPTSHILATAPSNSAADLITSRLASARLGPRELFRAYAPSRSKDDIPISVSPYTYKNANGHFSVPSMSDMLRFRVIVTTCVSASIMKGIGMPRGHFSHIFVDEAGQATEPEVMIGIKSMADNSTNVVLSGDPKQLGPIIRSTVARVLGLETSYIERLMRREVYDEVQGYGKS
ncbi:hypothetical protein GYMLUDRAFT_998794 [Collybiopsis luxurians FD-317 M1]|uniref:C2H2-type domain-containing protein n=1 Tax=Collybiopsis luxurians FD-317 M1 TaxID=944289 RepID=A0A0D0CX15_9AGAR|nr:hypothetical protein GYMLUDRAFT_998794 [Collybiopsis luxurians FD-317 M1]